MEEVAAPGLRPSVTGTREKCLAMLEILVVYAAVAATPFLFSASLGKWQLRHYHGTPFVHLFLFLLLPLALTGICRRSFLSLGLTFAGVNAQLWIGWRSALVLFYLATWPIGVLDALRIGYRTLPGAIVLALIEIPVILWVTHRLKALPQPETRAPSLRGIIIFALVPVTALGVMTAVAPFSQRVSNLVFLFFLIGLGEEVFFRGYIQGRLNEAFGRPYTFRGIAFGPGLIIIAALFGLIHPIGQGLTQWPWALWTFAIGITFGLIREKANSVLPAAFAHGLFDLPIAFFG